VVLAAVYSDGTCAAKYTAATCGYEFKGVVRSNGLWSWPLQRTQDCNSRGQHIKYSNKYSNTSIIIRRIIGVKGSLMVRCGSRAVYPLFLFNFPTPFHCTTPHFTPHTHYTSPALVYSVLVAKCLSPPLRFTPLSLTRSPHHTCTSLLDTTRHYTSLHPTANHVTSLHSVSQPLGPTIV
jgi:hypothetical protein